MRFPKLLASCLAALAGCSSIPGERQSDVLIPNKTFNVSRSWTPSMEGIAAAVALYFIVDPLAPNWQVGQARLDERHFRIDLKMKRFTNGGDGEALQVFQRQARRIAQEAGAPAFEIMEYSEGIESEILLARRVAQGVIRVNPK